jgi:hypothetical protein
VQARAAALANPTTTWIDAFLAIERCLAQLSWAAPGDAIDEVDAENGTRAPVRSDEKHQLSCQALLEEAERVLSTAPHDEGRPSLVLVRAYLTGAIVETSGREP